MSFSLKQLVAAGCLACLAGIGSAVGATITFVESAGNLNGPGLTNLGAFDVGTNTVSGSLAGSCVPGDCNASPGGASGNSQDTFKVQVLAGMQLTSILVTTANVTGPTNFSASYQQSPGGPFVPFLTPLNGTTANLLGSPVGPGIYTIGLYGQQASTNGPFALDYSVAFGVVPVPVPAAVWLFGSALGVMGVMRRKITA